MNTGQKITYKKGSELHNIPSLLMRENSKVEEEKETLCSFGNIGFVIGLKKYINVCVLLQLKCAGVKLAIDALFGNEFFMVATLNNAAMV